MVISPAWVARSSFSRFTRLWLGPSFIPHSIPSTPLFSVGSARGRVLRTAIRR